MPGPSKPRVLVVDDKLAMAETLADGLGDQGYDAVAVDSAKQALAKLESEPFDALVTDLRMPDMDGLELLAASQRLARDRPVIVMTAYGAIDTAVESIRRGAHHYLTKPFKIDELVIFLGRALEDVQVRREARALKSALGERYSRAGVVARSPRMRAALDVLDRVAPTDAPVLIQGETGSGKGLFAHLVHAQSPRAHRAMLTVNCAALPDNLLESELFGHVKGAFTGATANQAGLFLDSDGGTIFLDEIGEMSSALQAKLLHVLEGGGVRPVGSSKERPVNVRILAATHRDLRERVRAGSFREDLLYRLEVIPIELPALRHRKEDIPELVAQLLAAARAKHPKSPVERLSSEAMARVLDYPWPGNVRELAHALERAVLLGRGPEIALGDLPPMIAAPAQTGAPEFRGEVIPIRELQRRYAAWALEQMGGHKGRTAEKLGVDTKTLAKWLNSEDTAVE